MIAIRVLSREGEPQLVPLQACFGREGGDIGRGSDCTLVLPDPQRRISRKHVQIVHRDGRHFIRLMSTNLPVELEGIPLSPGVEYPVVAGANVRIGPYVLQVQQEPQAPTDDPMAAAPAAGLRASVFHDLLHPQEPPLRAGSTSQVDLVVGDTSGWRAGQAPPDSISALYAGLGLPASGERAASPQQLQLIGALLRASVAGTLGLLAARSVVKRELGAGLTMPQAAENNPLKFSPDTHAALRHLLGPTEQGFLPALDAVRKAFDDLKAHEMAVLAGMRGALEAVLARFDPKALEARLSKGRWDNLLPANHKARLWDRYGEMHAELMHEIENDFDDLFGRAFLEAYEAQLARLGARSEDHD